MKNINSIFQSNIRKYLSKSMEKNFDKLKNFIYIFVLGKKIPLDKHLKNLKKTNE